MSIKQPEITRVRDIIAEKTGNPAYKMAGEVYQEQGHQLFLAREQVRRNILTIEEWQQERGRIRKAFLETIGGSLPNEKVKIKECGEIVKKNVLIKKIMFAPFADHWVTANLYLPLNCKGKIPAVILPQGHALQGKIAYRERAVLFVANGYAALTFDYVGGGERNLLDKNGDIISFTSTQHNIAGNWMNLYGYNLQWFMIAETIAAVDVISMQPEVDPEKICMTGSSGGGTETFFTTALDPRIKVSAPAACIRSYSDEIEVDDTEQVFFNPILSGLGYTDIASFLIAPRPLLIVTNKKDIWGFKQVEYFTDEVKCFYRLHNSEENFSQTIWDRGHEYKNDQLEDAIKWFNLHLDNDAEFVPTEEIKKDDIPSEGECQVTEKGNLALEGYKSLSEIFAEHISKQKKANNSGNKQNLIQTFIAEKLQAVDTECQTQWKLIDSYQINNITGNRILFSPEKKVWLPVEILIPEKIKGISILLDESPRMNNLEWQIEHAAAGYLVVCPDMRGFGDTAGEDLWPDLENWALNIYAGKRYKLAVLARVVGRDLMLDRANDISSLINVLEAMGYKTKITIHGRRIGALVGIFAALTDTRIKKLKLDYLLKKCNIHYRKMYPLSWGDEMVFGILKNKIDIPDILKFLRKSIEVTVIKKEL